MKRKNILYGVVALVFAVGLGFVLLKNDLAPSESSTNSKTEKQIFKNRDRKTLSKSGNQETVPRRSRENFQVPEELESLIALLEEMKPEDTERGKMIMELAEAWAKIDPVEACAWAGTLELSESQLMSKVIALEISRSSPSEAFEMIGNLDEVSPQIIATAQFIALDHWVREDLETAWEACDTLTDLDFRKRMQQHLLVENSMENPASSARLLEKLDLSQTADGSFNGAAATIARELAREAYRATLGDEGGAAEIPTSGNNPAVEWAMKLPEGQTRASALSGAVGEWTLTNPVAASEWLLTYPSGKERDTIIEQMTALAQAPDISFHWAADAMTDSEARQRVLRRSATTWLAADPKAARQAIDSNTNLTDRERASIYENWEQAAPYFINEPSTD